MKHAQMPLAAYLAMRDMVRDFLERRHELRWSLQGFGMLRLHLGNTRIHVWDSRFAVPGVSTIHDHAQWGLTSHVISGEINNLVYVPAETGARYKRATIKAGPGGGVLNPLSDVRLLCGPDCYISRGYSYSQEPDEIHESRPGDGTVTVMHKRPTETDTATVYWPEDRDWVSAEPRTATPSEVETIVVGALARFRS